MPIATEANVRPFNRSPDARNPTGRSQIQLGNKESKVPQDAPKLESAEAQGSDSRFKSLLEGQHLREMAVQKSEELKQAGQHLIEKAGEIKDSAFKKGHQVMENLGVLKKEESKDSLIAKDAAIEEEEEMMDKGKGAAVEKIEEVKVKEEEKLDTAVLTKVESKDKVAEKKTSFIQEKAQDLNPPKSQDDTTPEKIDLSLLKDSAEFILCQSAIIRDPFGVVRYFLRFGDE